MSAYSTGEDGISTVELLTSSVVAALVLVVLVAGLFATNRTDAYTDEGAQSLNVLRSATGRLGRELRQARKVYGGSDEKSVHFWIDSNRDNQQNLVEKITWTLEQDGAGAKLVRRTDSGDSEQVAAGLLYRDAFSYSPAPPSATLVTISIAADPALDADAGERTVQFQVRLRNART